MVRKSTPEKVAELLTVMRTKYPRVYRGFVNRFAPPAAGIGGIWDSISNVVSRTTTAISNFASSQGFDKLLTAAEPFLKSELEKRSLKLDIQRINAGLPVATAPTGEFPTSESLPERRDPWPWVIGVAGVVGIIVLAGMGRRR